MKSTRTALILAVLVAFVAVAAATTVKVSPQSPALKGFHVQQPATLVDPNAPTWCSVCVDWMGNAVNQIINIILNVGIPGDCQALCQLYPGGSVDQALCEMYCDYKGLNYFINLLNNFNPDFIAICENLDVCPRTLTAKATITKLLVTPTAGPQGQTFDINLEYQVTSKLGTGMLIVQVNPPDAPFLQEAVTIVALPPATYKFGVQVQTQPNQDEPFNPGQYQVIVAICEGTCGGAGPYSYQLAQSQTLFTITQ
jgi:hypothetical protein